MSWKQSGEGRWTLMQPFILSRRTWGVANWRCPTRESLLMKETSFHICVSINLWRKKKKAQKNDPWVLLIFPLLTILCWWLYYLYCRVQITWPRTSQIGFFLSMVLTGPPALQHDLSPLQWGLVSSWMNLGCTGCVSKCLPFSVYSSSWGAAATTQQIPALCLELSHICGLSRISSHPASEQMN